MGEEEEEGVICARAATGCFISVILHARFIFLAVIK